MQCCQALKGLKCISKHSLTSFLTSPCIKNIKINESVIWQAIFETKVKFSLVPDIRDLLTFGDLINILICIMIVWMNRVPKYKHVKRYFVVLWLILPKIQWFMFPLPLNFSSNRASTGVAYDVIFSVIAGLPKVYPNFSDVPHGVLQ